MKQTDRWNARECAALFQHHSGSLWFIPVYSRSFSYDPLFCLVMPLYKVYHNHLLITASSSTSLNTLGLSFPGCGAGVMLPISTKPNPAFNIPSTASPCLSKPAAKPTGLRNWRPNTLVCWIRHFKIRWSNTMKKILC